MKRDSHATAGTRNLIEQLKCRFRHVRLLLGVALILVVVSSFLSPTLLKTEQRNPTSHLRPRPRRFTILNRNNSTIHHQRQNQLQKPFRWYREHWYNNKSRQQKAGNAWDSTDLPFWMKDYFEWHRKQSTATTTEGNQRRYLVVQCLQQDQQCGGLADRLLALPFFLHVAAQTQRVLVIVWTVPFPLQEFWMPPSNGMDWMLPVVTVSNKQEVLMTEEAILEAPSIVDKTVFVRVSTLLPAAHNQSLPVVRTRIQDYQTAWRYYGRYHHHHHHQNMVPKGAAADASKSFAKKQYREIFHVLFEPSPPLATAIRKQQQQLLLSTQQQPYAVAHYRALYSSGDDKKNHPPATSFLRLASENAVRCASELLPPGAPVVFLSDSHEARQHVMTSMKERQSRGKVQPVLIVPSFTSADASTSANMSSIHTKPPPQASWKKLLLHLDKATRGTRNHDLYQPADFYDTFLDLHLMAHAQCVSYGQGGFGMMGSLLSQDPTCRNRHFENGSLVRC